MNQNEKNSVQNSSVHHDVISNTTFIAKIHTAKKEACDEVEIVDQ
jgi:hypothetical protein